MPEIDSKVIGKYALLLSISYLLEFSFNKYIYSIDTGSLTRTNMLLIWMSPTVFSLLLNVITAVVIYQQKLGKRVKTRYVIIATIIYRPVGVVAFLLYSIYCKEDLDEVIE